MARGANPLLWREGMKQPIPPTGPACRLVPASYLVLLFWCAVRVATAGGVEGENAAVPLRAAFAVMYRPGPEDKLAWHPKPEAWPKDLHQLVPDYLEDAAILSLPPDTDMATRNGRPLFSFKGADVCESMGCGVPQVRVFIRIWSDGLFDEAHGSIGGFADGHAAWIPEQKGALPVALGERIEALIDRTKIVASALHRYALDHGQDFTTVIPPWLVMKTYLRKNRAPPSVCLVPSVAAVCRANREAVTVHLERAAAAKGCDFALDWKNRVVGELSHLSGMGVAWTNALCYGKYLEAIGDSSEAIEVYSNLFRASRHLIHDEIVMSSVIGIHIERSAVQALTALAVRHEDIVVPRKVANALKSLRKLKPRWDPVHIYVAAFKVKARFWKVVTHGDGAPELTEEDRRYVKRLFLDDRHLRDMRAHAKRMVSTLRLRPDKAYPRIKQLRHQALWSAVDGLAGVYGILVKVKAELGASQILVASLLHKIQKGTYPRRLSDMAYLFPDGIPRNPWNGQDYRYSSSDTDSVVTIFSPLDHRARSPVMSVSAFQRREGEFIRLGLEDKIRNDR